MTDVGYNHSTLQGATPDFTVLADTRRQGRCQVLELTIRRRQGVDAGDGTQTSRATA